jgi:hypothetical protein
MAKKGSKNRKSSIIDKNLNSKESVGSDHKNLKKSKQKEGKQPLTSKSKTVDEWVVDTMKNKFSVFLTLLVGLFACYLAFVIRLIPIQLFGLLIHEFDPWFNFRATK